MSEQAHVEQALLVGILLFIISSLSKALQSIIINSHYEYEYHYEYDYGLNLSTMRV